MQDKFSDELAMARRVQQALLSLPTPLLPGVRIAKRCIPAESVGGDFYVLTGNGQVSGLVPSSHIPGVVQYADQRQSRLDIVIGDVAGHGVSSALVMALSAGLIGEIGKTAKSTAQALQLLNSSLYSYINNSQIPYVTAFYSRYYPATRRLEWSRGGHPPALLLRGNGITELESQGLFLGMFDAEHYEQGDSVLLPGDRVIFYTDGITETRDGDGNEFGLDQLIALLIQTCLYSVEQQLDTVYQKLSQFEGHRSPRDDRTIVLLAVE